MNAQPVILFNHRLRQHPDFQRLLADADYYWRPMMSSVARPSTVAGELRQLRTEVDKLSQIVREGRR